MFGKSLKFRRLTWKTFWASTWASSTSATDSDSTVYTGEGVEHQRRSFAHRRRNLQRRQTRLAERKPQSLQKQARLQRDSHHCISNLRTV